jgi:hypothetical protein
VAEIVAELLQKSRFFIQFVVIHFKILKIKKQLNPAWLKNLKDFQHFC